MKLKNLFAVAVLLSLSAIACGAEKPSDPAAPGPVNSAGLPGGPINTGGAPAALDGGK